MRDLGIRSANVSRRRSARTLHDALTGSAVTAGLLQVLIVLALLAGIAALGVLLVYLISLIVRRVHLRKIWDAGPPDFEKAEIEALGVKIAGTLRTTAAQDQQLQILAQRIDMLEEGHVALTDAVEQVAAGRAIAGGQDD